MVFEPRPRLLAGAAGTWTRAGELNYSERNRPQEGDESAETVREGSMPPRSYLLTPPEARLTDAELAGWQKVIADSFGGEREHEEGDGRDR